MSENYERLKAQKEAIMKRELDRIHEPLEARISTLEKERASLERRVGELAEALSKIKAHCVGNKIPNWRDGNATYWSRGIIADIVDAALASAPREGTEEPNDGFTGWVCGPNYRRRGRVLTAVGTVKGEPWYEVDDGTKWSAFDVEFRPDKLAPADSPADREHVRVQELEKERDALAAALEKRSDCIRCGGTGNISVKHGLTYITDSPDELVAAWHDEKCPACGVDPAKILEARDVTIRKEARRAALVEAAEMMEELGDDARDEIARAMESKVRQLRTMADA